MQDAGFGPFNKLTLNYATTGNPDSKRLAAVFQAMARQIYVDVRISVSDYALELRALRLGQYQLGYATWLADFDDASNFLDLLKSDSPGNYAGYRNPKFDAALEAAEREPDTGKRAPLLKSAERIALADLPWLPIRFLSQSEVGGAARRRLCAQCAGLQSQPLALDQKITARLHRRICAIWESPALSTARTERPARCQQRPAYPSTTKSFSAM